MSIWENHTQQTKEEVLYALTQFMGGHDGLKWVYINTMSDCINHSYKPNVTYFVEDGCVGRVSVCDIDPGDELFIDYEDYIYPPFYSQFCQNVGLKHATEIVFNTM